MSYNPELYMHELDKKAFDALSAFPKLVKLQEAYAANVDEKIAKIEMLSTAIRLSDKQLPEIYSLLPPICNKLGIPIPELYMEKSFDKKDLNAWTFGSVNPIVVITSELVKQCPPEMVASVIAHECGHIACKHSLYHMLAQSFVNGINDSPLYRIPAIRKYITPSLVKALLFWDRCSELSADRAAVLCDGSAEKTIDMLLRINGFDDTINRDEFIKQALDLKDFVNDSKANAAIEQMIVQWKSHPLLATRAYECYDWEKSDQYKGIVDGSITIADIEFADVQETNVAEIEVSVETESKTEVPQEAWAALNQRLDELNGEIERYTNYADKFQYAVAIGCGLLSAALDIIDFKDTTVFNNDIGLSHKTVNKFIGQYAKDHGFEGERLKDQIAFLEREFKVAQDNIWKGANIGVSAKNHHLADLAHHPTPLGLASAIAVQFLRVGTFVNKEGEWHFCFVETSKEDIAKIVVPAIITGLLNWLAAVAEGKYEDETGEEMPAVIKKLAHSIASTPMLIEIIKCADNWFGHLVSDMGGSKQTAGGGMGIPGLFLSMMYEFSAIPGIKETGLTEVLNDLYVKGKLDMRHELAFTEQLKAQSLNVVFNEIMVRTLYLLTSIERYLIYNGTLKGINWKLVMPFGNRSVDRMLAISFMTFNIADTADAALRAAIESGGNWVVFSGRFVARYNFVGAGRTALAIVKEVSNEKKEAQLIHERMLLMDVKAQIMFERLQEFKAQLDEKLCTYLAEDIEAFMEGFDYINEGLASGDSNLVIKGNVVIQKVLGREPQFTTQEEFDDLMESDIPLVF